jgi:type I restriction enzyme M protein
MAASVNERITEDIVREHFKLYRDETIIEEQSSANPRIRKLLAMASKAGSGKGYPEFIIQFKNNSELLIVIECKGSNLKHESPGRDKYAEFAVDGALLYSSYLAREFDVLAIGVSGQLPGELKVSHFLQLKGEKTASDIFADKLLTASDYLAGVAHSPEKFRQDYDKLLVFSKNLNTKLHGYKILESDRSLLISCILIALENKPFLNSYKGYNKPEDLANYLVNTVEMMFKNSGIQGEKLDIVKARIDFIRTDTSLSTQEGVLKEIITDINDNINTFIRTYEYFDVLGQLYVEFLRYANSDKGLGIVLTPPHITDFMARLGEVNKNSVVYDSCAGTGGFLVSAMRLMIDDAKGDRTKIEQIKHGQLLGVEYQAHIFALACSNMYIHQDGKTNIYKGSCFDPKIIDAISGLRPTLGLLNPPYKADKKTDTEELEFVLANLNCLTEGGKCVAIVPMSSVIAQEGKVLELKRRMLQQHTLDAVLSMPDELFTNSKANVVTCVLVLTAKKPHLAGKKTFFGYFKDDGFVKKKNKGRIDAYGKWDAIKQEWLTVYVNHENKPGLSVNWRVKAEDEWCAEAYMQTDYSAITPNDFELAVQKYLVSELIRVAPEPVDDD